MKTFKYFAYGMNTNLDEMDARCPRALPWDNAVLNNYRFTFRHHADIEAAHDEQVHGVLWHITQKHLDALDTLEGYPYYYDRFTVDVVDSSGRVHQAITYQMKKQDYETEPSSGYLAMVTEGYEQNELPLRQIESAINRICSTLNVIDMA